MSNLRSKRESFEREFGKVMYPEPTEGKSFSILALLIPIILVFFSLGAKKDLDFVLVVLFCSPIIFFIFKRKEHADEMYCLTTKGVYINDHRVKKILIPWGDISKVQIETRWLSILICDQQGTEYGLYYSGKGKGIRKNYLFRPFMKCLKEFRPDIVVNFYELDPRKVVSDSLKETMKRPWFTIIGILIFILIFVTNFFDLSK